MGESKEGVVLVEIPAKSGGHNGQNPIPLAQTKFKDVETKFRAWLAKQLLPIEDAILQTVGLGAFTELKRDVSSLSVLPQRPNAARMTPEVMASLKQAQYVRSGISYSKPVQTKDLIGGSSYSNSNLSNCFADDPVWEATKRGPSAIGKSTEQASGWIVFRILIPKEQVKYNKNDVDEIREETEAQIGIYPAEPTAGVTVVMVWGKEHPGSSTNPAVRGLLKVQKYFPSDFLFPETCLLVPAAQASSLVMDSIINTIEEKFQCSLYIYLTDKVSILSPGDVIIKVIGRYADKAIALIALYLRGFTVDEGAMSDLEAQNGIPTPDNAAGDAGKYAIFEGLNTRRDFEIQLYRRISLFFASSVMGLNGKNIVNIQQSCKASIILEPASRNEMIIQINGGSTHEVEVAKELLEGCIGSSLDRMGVGVMHLCPHEKYEEGF